MGFLGNWWPYTNEDKINLDWVLRTIKTLETNLTNFVSLNSIKYANPFQWDITSQYEQNTLVIDGADGTAYLSVQPVPVGVQITNTDYWTPVFTLQNFTDALKKAITLFPQQENGQAATEAIPANSVFFVGDVLCTNTAEIPNTSLVIVGSNCQQVDVVGLISKAVAVETNARAAADTALDNKIGAETATREAADTALASQITAETTAREAADTELETKINSMKYTSTLFDIREYGAVGDGVTDDSNAIQAAITAAEAANGGCVYIPLGNYVVSKTLLISYSGGISIIGNRSSTWQGNGSNIVYTGTGNCIEINTSTNEGYSYNVFICNISILFKNNCNALIYGKMLNECNFNKVYIAAYPGTTARANYGICFGTLQICNFFECAITYCGIGLGYSSATGAAYNFSSDVTVSDCNFFENTSTAILLAPTTETFIVQNTWFEAAPACVLMNAANANAKNFVMQGCTFYKSNDVDTQFFFFDSTNYYCDATLANCVVYFNSSDGANRVIRIPNTGTYCHINCQNVAYVGSLTEFAFNNGNAFIERHNCQYWSSPSVAANNDDRDFVNNIVGYSNDTLNLTLPTSFLLQRRALKLHLVNNGSGSSSVLTIGTSSHSFTGAIEVTLITGTGNCVFIAGNTVYYCGTISNIACTNLSYYIITY